MSDRMQIELLFIISLLWSKNLSLYYFHLKVVVAVDEADPRVEEDFFSNEAEINDAKK